ncbi:SoxR reducing system RseC family protein [Aromatoleum buckelii]|uniref:Fis family transcriptional regulator n=2 Tax=Aromatoleum buckelii TaxID=200254 RepID=A0ABX1N367_9RHOO|nr:SoxR reducing system RseC family protein [Aromatoleum buckelii]MCK0513155.1 SoxR reducing system RseC family protein [Aromatoleum buckelii]
MNTARYARGCCSGGGRLSTTDIAIHCPQDDATLIEGIAHVVALERGVAWLEPEQTDSCGGCAGTAKCGTKGIGTLASRLEARRFPLADGGELRIGERVVVGVREDALVKASMTAYAMPLVTTFAAGAAAQASAQNDGITVAACALGLAIGLGIARLIAQRLNAHGEIAPRLLRRAGPPPDFRPE